MAERLGVTRHVLGDDWLLGAEEQERERASVRQEFDRFVKANGCTLLEEPRERTQYDEERGEVILTVRALADRL